MKTTDSIRLTAPAKVNLSFQIKHRRADGFHEVETLMAPITLRDEITISRVDGGKALEFTCDDPTLSTGADNLVVRAARLFLASAGVEAGLHIHLRKVIPHGAGLGGGSSDAAATLLGLNQLLGPALPLEKLSALAAQIGSDVPFFLYQSATVCRGRGELVEPRPLGVSLPLLLLKPSFGVPTPAVYARWATSRELPDVPYTPQAFRGMTFFNDLERPVYEKHVFLARAKTWLLAQSEVGAAMLSGSGSTMFAVLRDATQANSLGTRARAALDPELWTFACETIPSL